MEVVVAYIWNDFAYNRKTANFIVYQQERGMEVMLQKVADFMREEDKFLTNGNRN